MDLNLKGRTAFVTGASRGIGRSIAFALAAEGVNLGLFGRDMARCNGVAAELRAKYPALRIAVIEMDVADPAAIKVQYQEIKSGGKIAAVQSLELVIGLHYSHYLNNYGQAVLGIMLRKHGFSLKSYTNAMGKKTGKNSIFYCWNARTSVCL